MHSPFLVRYGIGLPVVYEPETRRMASNARERTDDCKRHKAKNTFVARLTLKMHPRCFRPVDRLAVPTAKAILIRPAYRIFRNDTLDWRSASQPHFAFIGQRPLLRRVLWNEQVPPPHPLPRAEMVSRLLSQTGT